MGEAVQSSHHAPRDAAHGGQHAPRDEAARDDHDAPRHGASSRGARRLQAPQAAYLHVPFCRHRCGYCNFTVVAGRDDLTEQFLTALDRELAAQSETARPVTTLFIGGGTPTHLPPPQLARLLPIARRFFPLADSGEFSIEANPADMNEERAAVLAEFGVTRVSLGTQSFSDRKLKVLERDHDAAQVARAVELSRQFAKSVSLDLIFAAPDETLADWEYDLAAAIALQPDHVSTYGLTFERGTAFWSRRMKGELVELPDERQREMYLLAIDRLAAAGLEHYEISNFARPGRRCRHNEVYWSADEYFAAGPGAARYVAGSRETNHRSTTTWINRVLSGQSPVAESEVLPPKDKAREALMLGLRRTSGVDCAAFAGRFGYSIESLLGPALTKLLELGLLKRENDALRLTRDGLLLSDAVFAEFLRR
ncbi:MAG: radical SAM family heme chaperone HemW [Planctomycetia bacterium]|nr:radical SAM family heme chaperone HemW [Planctomycetia bacterium]